VDVMAIETADPVWIFRTGLPRAKRIGIATDLKLIVRPVDMLEGDSIIIPIDIEMIRRVRVSSLHPMRERGGTHTGIELRFRLRADRVTSMVPRIKVCDLNLKTHLIRTLLTFNLVTYFRMRTPTKIKLLILRR